MRLTTLPRGLAAAAWAMLAQTAFVHAAQETLPPDCDDPRTLYDVTGYRLDLRLDPSERRVVGAVAVEGRALVDGLGVVTLDLAPHMRVARASRLGSDELTPSEPLGAGDRIAFRHEGASLSCDLPTPLAHGEPFTLLFRYSGNPECTNTASGFHWRETEDGEPWLGANHHAIGAHNVWPCKASFFHPEDKPDHVWVNLTVPEGLTAVSNGRLEGVTDRRDGRKTFHWECDYAIPTHAVGIHAGPFEVEEQLVEVEGSGPLTFVTYALPEDTEKARLQFAEVPRIAAVYSRAFGPFPFPEAKLAVVQAPFPSAEHATLIAYGSTFPAWRAREGLEDPLASYNRGYDAMLVHELAHEWWGNSVSTACWSDLWLHEGFATFAEGLYVEEVQGREAADAFFNRLRSRVCRDWTLASDKRSCQRSAFSTSAYYKGAWALHLLRHFMDDDEAFFGVLRELQARHRHGTIRSIALLDALEAVTGEEWTWFFDQWIKGAGCPRLEGSVQAEGARIVVQVLNKVTDDRHFQLPLDLAWTQGGKPRERRLWLQPHHNHFELELEAPAKDLAVVRLQRLLGRHRVEVR